MAYWGRCFPAEGELFAAVRTVVSIPFLGDILPSPFPIWRSSEPLELLNPAALAVKGPIPPTERAGTRNSCLVLITRHLGTSLCRT